MCIMSACVHFTWMFGGVGEPCTLCNRKSIHVCPKSYGFSRMHSIYRANYSCACDTGYGFDIPLFKFVSNKSGGLHFIKSQFRYAMQFFVKINDFIF